MGKTDSLIRQYDNCYLCGKYIPLQTHHLVFGRNRKLADKYGLTVDICFECHSMIHGNKEFMDRSKNLGQALFEFQYGHDRWFDEFKTNFYETIKK